MLELAPADVPTADAVCERYRERSDWFSILVVWRAARRADSESVEIGRRLAEAEVTLDRVRVAEGIGDRERGWGGGEVISSYTGPVIVPAHSPAGELVDEMVSRLRGGPPVRTLPPSTAGARVSTRLGLGDSDWQREVMVLRLQDARDDDTYYESSHWRTFALQQKRDAGPLCADCGRKGALDTHHLTYERLGEEWPQDVVVVCGTCHDVRHGRSEGGAAASPAAGSAWSATDDDDSIPF